MSEEYGPETLILILFKCFIAGIISFFSLFSLSKLSQWGFNPVTAILGVIFKRSKYRIAMRATSFDQEAALAQGINVGRVFGLVWLIAGILAGFSGFFITGGFNTLTQASFISALRALPAVVIGGLDSIAGAVVGSLIIGLTQGYIAYYQLPLESIVGFTLGSGFSLIAPYLVMFIILLIKPDGLFGTKEVERV